MGRGNSIVNKGFAALLLAALLSVSLSGCGSVDKSEADEAEAESTGVAETGENDKESVLQDEAEKDDNPSGATTTVEDDTDAPTGKDHSIKKMMPSEEVFDILYGIWQADDSDEKLIFSAGVGDISYKAELKSEESYGFNELVSYFDAAVKDYGTKIRFITGKGGLGSCREMILSEDQQSVKYKTGTDVDEEGNRTDNYVSFRKVSDSVIPDSDSKWKGRVGAFLGDSITAGFNTTEGNVYWNYLSDLLKLKDAEAYGVAGSCISSASDIGTGTAPFTERYKEIRKDADFIVVFGGTNDYGFNTPLGSEDDRTDVSFYGALYEMLTGLKKDHPDAVIVFMTPLHRCEFGGLKYDKQKNEAGHTLDHYIKAIKKRCAELEIPVIDSNAVYGMNPSDEYVKNNYLTDGLHPNEEGHKILAERIASCFEAL